MYFQKSFFYAPGQSDIPACITEITEVASINDTAFVK